MIPQARIGGGRLVGQRHDLVVLANADGAATGDHRICVRLQGRPVVMKFRQHAQFAHAPTGGRVGQMANQEQACG